MNLPQIPPASTLTNRAKTDYQARNERINTAVTMALYRAAPADGYVIVAEMTPEMNSRLTKLGYTITSIHGNWNEPNQYRISWPLPFQEEQVEVNNDKSHSQKLTG